MSVSTTSPALESAFATLRSYNPCVISAEHPDTVAAVTLGYVSPTLTEEEREWCDSMVPEGHRTRFYDLGESEVASRG